MKWTWLALAALGLAETNHLQNFHGHRQICAGVYSKKDWGGRYDPQISVKFSDAGDHTGSLSIVVYAYEDIDSLGVEAGSGGHQYVCDHESIAEGMCGEAQYGQIIVSKYAPSKHPIKTERIDLPHDEPLIYEVEDTAYYCVATVPLDSADMKYDIDVTFRNAFGYLSASKAPLIVFHYVQAGVYGLVFLLWLWKFVTYRHDLLKVQKYITFLGLLMICEQLLAGTYYFAVNKNGTAKVLLWFVALYSSGRLAYTFFLLLIVCLGYSVVFESLGGKMKWCWALGVATFGTTLLYTLDSYYSSDDGTETDLIGVIVFVPLSVLLAINYLWTLTGLAQTVNYLNGRKQYVKVQMYVRLRWILIVSAFAIFGFVLLHTLIYLTESFKEFVNDYWKHKWVLSDGWPNVVYFCAFVLIALMWRPTGNNKRFAMSQQLAQTEADAEEFEIGSLNGSDDEEEGANAGPPSHPPPSGMRTNHGATVFDADADHGLSDLESDSELHEARGHRV